MCVCVCVCACVRACVRACVCVCVQTLFLLQSVASVFLLRTLVHCYVILFGTDTVVPAMSRSMSLRLSPFL